MNISANKSTNMGEYVSECTLYLVGDSVTIAMCVWGILVTILTFVSNLVMIMYFRQLQRNFGGTLYYKAINIMSMFAAVLGQPLETANTLMKTSHVIVNLASNFFLFFLFCGTYHCIAGLTFERYLAIKREGAKKRLEKNILTSAIIILVIFMCLPTFYNIYSIILARYRCKQPPDSWITLATMCTWLTYCSFLINFLTKRAIKFVRSYDEFRQKKLGKGQRTNIKRLKVTKRVWFVFSLVWLPYALVNALHSVLSVNTYEHLNAIARGLTFLSFTVLPWVYFFMDKNYANFVKRHISMLGRFFPSKSTRIHELQIRERATSNCHHSVTANS